MSLPSDRRTLLAPPTRFVQRNCCILPHNGVIYAGGQPVYPFPLAPGVAINTPPQPPFPDSLPPRHSAFRSIAPALPRGPPPFILYDAVSWVCRWPREVSTQAGRDRARSALRRRLFATAKRATSCWSRGRWCSATTASAASTSSTKCRTRRERSFTRLWSSRP